ncbi:hypothetical protein GH5_04914 [Leishmania sp. Ghana 2012 LV757]|uniref:hypothetical protein n=1 Tax=Leishmania sp. Ghana 2012 LV757 TaxID=2803181 RepID=UPI001B75910A|nr:hypothetical protein GH5_04914 [Leishmania sp. Ghana 2012 LV757]
MYGTQGHPQENGESDRRLMDDASELAQLGQRLPAHIVGTVLPLLSDEIASGVAELNAQVDGARQLLLQSAVLRRSTVLAPLLKQQLVTRAIQLQRRRAQLVQQLQRQARYWRSPAPGGGATSASASSSDGGFRRSAPLSEAAGAGPGRAGRGALHETWATLQEAFYFEEGRAHLVQAPLCPPTAALRALLTEVVTGGQCGLHRRVVEQVAGTSPCHGQSPTTAYPPTGAVGGSAKGDRDANVSGSGGSTGAEDAIEAALHLLLRYTRQAWLRNARGDRSSAREKAPRSASSAPFTGSTAFRASGGDDSLLAADPVGVCNVDVYSDNEEEQVQDAEEDAFENRRMLQQQRTATSTGGAPGSGTDSPTAEMPSAAGAAPLRASMWLRVPGILTLSQYCAELPWVADLADQRYDEARERKKHGSGGAGEVGYISRHVQPEEQGSGEGVECKEARYEAGYIAPTHVALQMMPPLGYLFAPALAAGTAGSASDGGESVVGRAVRHTSGGTACAPRAAPAECRPDREGASSAQEEERSWLARVVVKCVSAAVDEAWHDVEEAVVAPFCAQRRRGFSSRAPPGEATLATASAAASAGGEEAAEVEEEALTQFMEVLRVRYAVELAAQVLAARHATELLLDSEDSVIFAEARLSSLVVGGGSFSADACSGSRGVAAAKRTPPSPAPVLTCTVLSLPGVKEIFYVMAYCTGAALLCDVAAAVTASGHDAGSRQDGAGARQQRGCLPVDVDAEEEGEQQVEGHPARQDNRQGDGPRRVLAPSAAQRADLADEEDPVSRRQASLQAWATRFESEHLRENHITAASAESACATDLASARSSWSLAPYYRLWLYVWEYVLVVVAPPSSAAHSEPKGGAAERDRSMAQNGDGSQRFSHHLRGQRQDHRHGGTGFAQLPVAWRTARRWMEKVIRASVMHGCAEVGLLVGCATPQNLACEPAATLRTHLSAEQTQRLIKVTTVQARHALLKVSGAVGGEGTAPSH